MRRLNVLLVEDDDDMRTLYGFMLAKSGYQVRAVKNGLDALAELQIEHPDLIITDIAMPVLDGLELIKIVKTRTELSALPVIAITSYGKEFCRLARSTGANAAIDKPTEEEELQVVINSVCAQ